MVTVWISVEYICQGPHDDTQRSSQLNRSPRGHYLWWKSGSIQQSVDTHDEKNHDLDRRIQDYCQPGNVYLH